MNKEEKTIKNLSGAKGQPQKIERKFKGTVVSDKMAKTIVVRVDHLKMHPIYKKQFKLSKKYKVHDEKEQYKTGEVVEFIQCRPISKDKKFRALYKNIKK